MFDLLMEGMQKDAAKEMQAEARIIRYYRIIAIVHHLFALGTGLLAFLVLLFGFLFASKHQEHGANITIFASVLSMGILVIGTLLKRNQSFLGIINRTLSSVTLKIRETQKGNPFFAQYYTALLLLYLPLCLMIIVAVVSKSPWIIVTEASSQMFIDPVKQIITFTAIILPVQVALFTFMFAQLLGKYSSRIVGALYGAPPIMLLWLYPVVSLLLLNLACFYGYPESLRGVLAFFFASLNVICLALTIWTANAGTQADKVIIYAGKRFSQKVRRKTKIAISESSRWSRLQVVLNYLGLDWRDPRRRILFSPPAKAMAITNLPLASLFNVANKAVAEGQHEVFVSALVGIGNVMRAYVEKRASYFGTTDPVISYTVDQMASLLSASSKSSNEYLITDAVQLIGNGALVSLLIDPLPRKKDPSPQDRMLHANHPLSSSWINLLGEAFGLSHTLMRSTAASEAINQLARIAMFGFRSGYGDVVFVGYLPKIKEIHSICIARPDVYHLMLGGDCITKTMGLWAMITIKYGQWSCKENLNEQIADAILQMAVAQFVVEKLPSFNFHDPTIVLTTKINRDCSTIQDIFFITLSRSFSEWWEVRETIDDLRRIIQLVAALATAAVANKIASAKSYVEAFYEISYFVLRGLPGQYIEMEEAKNVENEEFHRPMPSAQEILEEEVFRVWSQLFPVFFKAENHLGLNWQQDFFGIIGIGIVRYEDQRRDSLRSGLIRLIQGYLDLCLQENANRDHGIREWGWDYLQLVGAWTHYFLKDETLSKTIASEIAHGRPFHYSEMAFIISSRGRYGTYGYPGLSLHSDFYLPWLRNLLPKEHLSDQECKTFELWQEMLMKKEVLIQYYKIVEETRGPLEDAFYKNMREQEEKKKGNKGEA